MTASKTFIPRGVIEKQWKKALETSGVESSIVALVVCDGERWASEPPAQWISPEVNVDSYAFYRDIQQFDRWTSNEKTKLHRITVAARVPDGLLARAMTGAILAHELHHVFEWEHGGASALRLRPIIEDHVLQQLHGSALTGAQINEIPYELDCDAAAARFLRKHHAADIPAILHSDDPSPARQTEPPADAQTLPERTVEYLRDQVRMLDKPLQLPIGKRSIRDWVEEVSPGSGEIWDSCERERGD